MKLLLILEYYGLSSHHRYHSDLTLQFLNNTIDPPFQKEVRNLRGKYLGTNYFVILYPTQGGKAENSF